MNCSTLRFIAIVIVVEVAAANCFSQALKSQIAGSPVYNNYVSKCIQEYRHMGH
jgi:hypothetical protein